MTDPEFMDLAERALRAIEAGCDLINDSTEADIDNQRSGGTITLVFANRSQIVINLQKPLHEIWLAARSGGFHFRYHNGVWKDTKGHGELFEMLSRYASDQAELPLRFAPAAVSS